MDKMDGMTMNIEQANVEKLREVFPEVFADGKVDFDKLQGLLGHYIADDKEKYSFSWKGKADSLRLAQKRSTGTLRPCKEESKNWDTTENLYIEGDNLEVLKLLQSSYLNSIKMIYIDPPYNTGNDFVYTDDFADGIARYKEVTGQATKSNPETAGRYHTNWLNMMYPRLKLARNLLTDDGVIFISIDDNEVSNLRKLCDEVFGEDNFVADVIWKRKRGRDNSAKWFSKSHEYLLIFAKKLEEFNTNYLELNEETKAAYKNPDNDPRGPYRMLGCWARGTQGGVKYDFTTKNGQYFTERLWLFSKENLQKLDEEDKLIIHGDNVYRKMFIFENKGKIPETIWDSTSNAANAADEIKKIFGGIIFDTPKPIPYLIEMLKVATDKESLILDFFSGSATTAHAVMQLNAEDGGNRKFICVQLPEKTDGQSEAYKAGYKTICEIGKERIRRAGERIKDGHNRVDIYVSAIDDIIKNESIKFNIKSYVREVENKWYENEDDPDINVEKVIETIKAIINSEDDKFADESTYEKGGEKLSDLVMRLAYEVTGLTFGVDIGFKVFKLDSSNLVKWDNTPTTDEEEVKKRIQQSLFYLVEGREDLDLVYEIMLKYGLSLTLPVEERKFDGVTAYIINHPDYKVLICLQPNITLSAVEEMDKETIGTYIFADRCFADANILSNTEEILKKKDKEMRLF